MLSEQTKSLIPKIVDYLKGQPVVKAWLFGSCARGEETPESDVDLLVSYDYAAKVSLLTVSKLRVQLRELLKRDVDLVEDGYLLPYAAETAEKDRILIYERLATRHRAPTPQGQCHQ